MRGFLQKSAGRDVLRRKSWMDNPDRDLPSDDGCEVATSCLQCPLPQCKYDDPRDAIQERHRTRAKEILRMQKNEGLTRSQLAKRMGVSVRTVYRTLKLWSIKGGEE